MLEIGGRNENICLFSWRPSSRQTYIDNKRSIFIDADIKLSPEEPEKEKSFLQIWLTRHKCV